MRRLTVDIDPYCLIFRPALDELSETSCTRSQVSQRVVEGWYVTMCCSGSMDAGWVMRTVKWAALQRSVWLADCDYVYCAREVRRKVDNRIAERTAHRHDAVHGGVLQRALRWAHTVNLRTLRTLGGCASRGGSNGGRAKRGSWHEAGGGWAGTRQQRRDELTMTVVTLAATEVSEDPPASGEVCSANGADIGTSMCADPLCLAVLSPSQSLNTGSLNAVLPIMDDENEGVSTMNITHLLDMPSDSSG